MDSDALLSQYVRFGRVEGRLASGFSSSDYAALNSDLFAAFGVDAIALVRHFITLGRAEGRLTSVSAVPKPATFTVEAFSQGIDAPWDLIDPGSDTDLLIASDEALVEVIGSWLSGPEFVLS